MEYSILQQETSRLNYHPSYLGRRDHCFFAGDRINDDDYTCALFQNALQMSVRHGCWHIHDGAACRRGTHWQW